MAPPTIRGSGSAGGEGSANLTLTPSTAAVNGDLVLIFVAHALLSTPAAFANLSVAGFTSLGISQPYDWGRTQLFGRIASSDGASYTITGFDSNTDDKAAGVVIIRDWIGGSLPSNVITTPDSAPDTTVSIAAITTAGADSLDVVCAGSGGNLVYNSSNNYSSWGSSLIELIDVAATGANPYAALGIAAAARASAGSQAATTVTQSQGDVAAVIRLEVQAAGGTTYTDAGQGTAVGQGSGADSLLMADGGQGSGAGLGSGADSLTMSEAGQGTGAAAGSGLDSLIVSEAGAGISAAVGGGADSWTMADSGTGTAATTGSGGDTFAGSDTGAGVAAGVGSCLDSLQMADSGQATGAAAASGSDVLRMVETGGAAAGAEGGGVDTFSGSTTDAGQGTAVAIGSGLDSLQMVDAGPGTASSLASGADSLLMADSGQATGAAASSGLDTWRMVDSGAAAAGCGGSGLDIFRAVETGGGLLVAVGSGLDQWGAPVYYNLRGTLIFPATTVELAMPERVSTLRFPDTSGTLSA